MSYTRKVRSALIVAMIAGCMVMFGLILQMVYAPPASAKLLDVVSPIVDPVEKAVTQTVQSSSTSSPAVKPEIDKAAQAPVLELKLPSISLDLPVVKVETPAVNIAASSSSVIPSVDVTLPSVEVTTPIVSVETPEVKVDVKPSDSTIVEIHTDSSKGTVAAPIVHVTIPSTSVHVGKDNRIPVDAEAPDVTVAPKPVQGEAELPVGATENESVELPSKPVTVIEDPEKVQPVDTILTPVQVDSNESVHTVVTPEPFRSSIDDNHPASGTTVRTVVPKPTKEASKPRVPLESSQATNPSFIGVVNTSIISSNSNTGGVSGGTSSLSFLNMQPFVSEPSLTERMNRSSVRLAETYRLGVDQWCQPPPEQPPQISPSHSTMNLNQIQK